MVATPEVIFTHEFFYRPEDLVSQPEDGSEDIADGDEDTTYD